MTRLYCLMCAMLQLYDDKTILFNVRNLQLYDDMTILFNVRNASAI
jgi:hypothetical protein